MSLRQHRLKLASLAVIGISAAVVWYGWPRSLPKVLPAPPNPYVKNFVLMRLDDGQPVADAVQIRPLTGFYAVVVIALADNAPDDFEGRMVSDPIHWPATLAVYPRSSRSDGPDVVEMPCLRFRPSRIPKRSQIVGQGPPPYPPSRGTTRGWVPSGYLGEPKLPKSLPQGEICVYTYFAMGKNPPGEYVYELRVYPTARWISSVRWEVGPPVVLQRGLLKVEGDKG